MFRIGLLGISAPLKFVDRTPSLKSFSTSFNGSQLSLCK
jgi:hypothetical protein